MKLSVLYYFLALISLSETGHGNQEQKKLYGTQQHCVPSVFLGFISSSTTNLWLKCHRNSLFPLSLISPFWNQSISFTTFCISGL